MRRCRLTSCNPGPVAARQAAEIEASGLFDVVDVGSTDGVVYDADSYIDL